MCVEDLWCALLCAGQVGGCRVGVGIQHARRGAHDTK